MNAIKKNKTTRTVYIYIYCIYITTTDVKKHVIFNKEKFKSESIKSFVPMYSK